MLNTTLRHCSSEIKGVRCSETERNETISRKNESSLNSSKLASVKGRRFLHTNVGKVGVSNKKRTSNSGFVSRMQLTHTTESQRSYCTLTKKFPQTNPTKQAGQAVRGQT